MGGKELWGFGEGLGGGGGGWVEGLNGELRVDGFRPEAYLGHILGVLPKWLSNRFDELRPWKVVFTDK
ncbi:hypothetical protein ACISSW_28505 [Escherichia coli]